MDAGIAIGSLVLLASLVTLVLTWPTRRRRGLGKKAAATSKGTDTDAGAGTGATAEAAPAADGTAGSDAEGPARTRHTV